MRCIVDSDSISFLLGWSFKSQNLDQSPESFVKAIETTDQFIKDILIGSKATEYMGFLGGVHPTFRHLSNHDYKANRGLTKPDWYNTWAGLVNLRLKNYWGFNYVEGIEAEDAVSMIAHYHNYKDTVIAHIDKDLMQIPGLHYNYSTQASNIVSSVEAARSLYKQVLMGDTTDNLPGIPGIGKAKSMKILANGNNSIDFMMLALDAFIKHFGEREGIIKFTESYAMVKLLDVPAIGFNPSTYNFIPCNFSSKESNNNLFLNLTSTPEDGSQYFIQS